ALTTTGLLQGRRARGGLEPTIERRQVVLHVPELTSLRQDLREPLVEGARPSGVAHARGLVGAFEERRGAAREHAWSHLARLEEEERSRQRVVPRAHLTAGEAFAGAFELLLDQTCQEGSLPIALRGVEQKLVQGAREALVRDLDGLDRGDDAVRGVGAGTRAGARREAQHQGDESRARQQGPNRRGASQRSRTEHGGSLV